MQDTKYLLAKYFFNLYDKIKVIHKIHVEFSIALRYNIKNCDVDNISS